MTMNTWSLCNPIRIKFLVFPISFEKDSKISTWLELTLTITHDLFPCWVMPDWPSICSSVVHIGLNYLSLDGL